MRMTRSIKRWWQGRQQSRYLRSRLHLVMDVAMLALVVVMLGLLAYAFFWRPETIGLPPIGNNGEPTVEPHFDQSDLPLDLEVSLSPAKEGKYRVEIGYENAFDRDLENVRLSLGTEGNAKLRRFDIISSSTNWQDEGDYILVDKIASGEKGKIEIDVEFASLAKQLVIKVSSGYASGSQTASESFASNQLIVPASINLVVDAYYYTSQGDQIGIGPIPPMVGLPTSYWILLDLSSSNGDLKDFALASTLPVGVKFTGNRTLTKGEMNYNEGARQIIWKVSTVEDGEKISGGFEVEITPIESQVGQTIVLVEKTAYSASDGLSGSLITGSAGKIDTRLEKDSLAASDGKVIR